MASGIGKHEIMRQCRKYYNTIDTNGDGKLNRVEFQGMCSEVGCSADLIGLERAYKKADKNGDGIVSFVEFMEAYASNLEDVKPSITVKLRQKHELDDTDYAKRRQYFHEIDSDGSGKLNINEFGQMLGKSGVYLEPTDLKKTYQKADNNGDGEVSFREFFSAFADETKTEKRRKSRKAASSVGSSRYHDINHEDIMEGLACFWNCDRNLDGRLDILEYSHLVALLNMKLSKRDVLKAFKVVAVSGQGYISFMDFVTTYIDKVMPGALTADKVHEIYRHCDIGTKGFLTQEEFYQCMEKLGNTANEGMLNKLMMTGNKQLSGPISRHNFFEFIGLRSNDALQDQ